MATRDDTRTLVSQALLLRFHEIGAIQIEIFLFDHLDLGEIFLECLEKIRGFADDHQAGRLGEIFLARKRSPPRSSRHRSTECIYPAYRAADRKSRDRRSERRNLDSSRDCARNGRSARPGAISIPSPLTGSLTSRFNSDCISPATSAADSFFVWADALNRTRLTARIDRAAGAVAQAALDPNLAIQARDEAIAERGVGDQRGIIIGRARA